MSCDDLDGKTAYELVLDRMCEAEHRARGLREMLDNARQDTAAAMRSRDQAHETALNHQRRITEIDPDGTANFLRVLEASLKHILATTPEAMCGRIGPEMMERLAKIADTLDPIPF